MGLGQSAHTTEALKVGARVTLRMGEQPTRERLGPSALGGACEAYAAAPVPPSEPRRSTGVYWGFSVRLARGLSGVLSGCPFQARTCPCATLAGRTCCLYSAWASYFATAASQLGPSLGPRQSMGVTVASLCSRRGA